MKSKNAKLLQCDHWLPEQSYRCCMAWRIGSIIIIRWFLKHAFSNFTNILEGLSSLTVLYTHPLTSSESLICVMVGCLGDGLVHSLYEHPVTSRHLTDLNLIAGLRLDNQPDKSFGTKHEGNVALLLVPRGCCSVDIACSNYCHNQQKCETVCVSDVAYAHGNPISSIMWNV